MNSVTQAFVGLLLVMNIIGFVLIAVDKKRVGKTDKKRIKEAAMLIVAGLFGAIGTLLAMLIFRHKWYKWYFKTFIPVLVILNILVAAIVLYFLIEMSNGAGANMSFKWKFWE